VAHVNTLWYTLAWYGVLDVRAMTSHCLQAFVSDGDEMSIVDTNLTVFDSMVRHDISVRQGQVCHQLG
jgi:hypothetical protein